MRLHVCMFACLHVYMSACKYIWCMHAGMHACACAWMHVPIWETALCANVSVQAYVCKCIRICNMRKCCICVCARMCICVWSCLLWRCIDRSTPVERIMSQSVFIGISNYIIMHSQGLPNLMRACRERYTLSKEVGKQYFRVTNDFYWVELTMMKGGTSHHNTNHNNT